MNLRSLSAARGQLARASEIATILRASGFDWLVAALGLGACVSLRCRVMCSLGLRQCPHHVDMELALPERMRQVLERLGPTFVKVGQMLALRPDYVPLQYAEALRALQADVPPFPAEQANRIVAAELEGPVRELFSEFEAEPFAAASLSQVHRARLPDGTPVAVKVQRPGIQAQMQRDLELLAFLARRLEHRRGEALGFRPTAAVAELASYTNRELDFRAEARTAQRVRELFADNDRVVVPLVHWDHSSARVLTMDLIEGRSPAPAAELQRAGLDPQALVRIGAEAIIEQIFKFGLFHADPHPGNILLLAGNRVCFLDFGMFGRLAPRERRATALMFWGLIDGDYNAVSERLLRLSTLGPGADPDGFREAVAETVESWFGRPAREFSVARLLLTVLARGSAHDVVFPRSLMLLARALVNVESTAALIDPELTLAELARPMLADLRGWLLLDREAIEQAWHRDRLDLLELAYELPALLPELVWRLRSGGVVETGQASTTPRRRDKHTGAALAAGTAAGVAAAWLARRASQFPNRGGFSS